MTFQTAQTNFLRSSKPEMLRCSEKFSPWDLDVPAECVRSKGLITLHFRSHHAMKTKVHTVRNSYREAILIASPDQTEASMKMVDQLYLNNGLNKHPRGYISSHKTFNPNYKPYLVC